MTMKGLTFELRRLMGWAAMEDKMRDTEYSDEDLMNSHYYDGEAHRASLEGEQPMNTYTLYWRTGKRETVQGADPAQAMTLAGYGGGAVRALDFYANGDDHDYAWDAERRDWVRNTTPNVKVTGAPPHGAETE